MKNRVILLLLVLPVIFSFSCKKEEQRSEDLEIGVILPLSGPFDFLGRDAERGLELALKKIEKAGGISINGIPQTLSFHIEDTAGNPEKTTGIVQTMLSSGSPAGIIGPVLSSTAIPAAGICENAGLPMISPSSTNPEVTKGKEYIFRACFTDDYQGKGVAYFLYEIQGIKEASVLYDVTNVYNRYAANAFIRDFTERGGTILNKIEYLQGEKDFSDEVNQIEISRPGAVYLPNYRDDIVLQIREFRRREHTPMIVGGDAVGVSAITAHEDRVLLEGMYYCGHFSYDREDSLAGSFLEEYRHSFDHPLSSLAPLMYDSVFLMVDAITRAGTGDPAKIADALRTPRKYRGITGDFQFNGGGDPEKNAYIIQLTGGGERLFRPIHPENVRSES